MKHAMVIGTVLQYMIQPGDATRYTFSLTHLDSFDDGIGFDEDYIGIDNIQECIAGINQDYVKLTVEMGDCCGTYEFRKESLRHPEENHFFGYARNKFPHVDEYTLMAILLAVSVLVDEPDNLVKAAEKMLKVKETEW